MERDQRVRIVGVGAAVSFARRRQTRNPRRKAAHNGAIVGGRQSGAETPARAGSSSKTEFAISPEEREVTTMNVCTAGGSQGNAAPPLKMAEKIAFAFAAHSLPPTSKKHASSSWRRTEDVGTVIKFPSLPRGPRASEGSAFALQNEAARLNGLFFQLPFRPRAEQRWSGVLYSVRGRICFQHAQGVETRGGWQILTPEGNRTVF